jgi:hypothetical protein
MADWIHKYPQVAALMQQSDDVLCSATATGPCCASDVLCGRTGWVQVRCDLDAEVMAPTGDPYCGWHFERFWVYPCCGAIRAAAVPGVWHGDREVEYNQTDAYWHRLCK